MYQTAPDFPAAESVLYNSPLGILILEADEAGLTAVRFSPEQAPDTAVRPGPITTRAAEWLDGYFSGSCPEPDFPLNLKGTPFQKEVWAILQTIPAGKTMTYGEIARILADRRGIDRMAARLWDRQWERTQSAFSFPATASWDSASGSPAMPEVWNAKKPSSHWRGQNFCLIPTDTAFCKKI